MSDKTPQQKMQEKLARVGIPALSIEVYGSQIVVKAPSWSSAERWSSLLSKFATVRGVVPINNPKDERRGDHGYRVIRRFWLVGAYV
jgi:hypothetical protein